MDYVAYSTETPNRVRRRAERRKIMSLDGGSAAPPTADVPTEGRATDLRTPARWLIDPEFAGIEILDYDGWRGADWRAPITVQEFRRRLWLCTITGPVPRGLDHSGVAGEPEATPKEASEIAVAVSPTPTHAPTPETPGASTTAGGVTVPDEAVEAAARADHAFGRLGDDPDWDGLTDTDRDSYRRAASSYLSAAAPLIVEHYLRQQIRDHEVQPTPEEVWDRVREMARHAALRTAAVDALRSSADALRAQAGTQWGIGDAAIFLLRRADELERGRRPVSADPVISDTVWRAFREGVIRSDVHLDLPDRERAGLRAAIAQYLTEQSTGAHVYLSTGCLHGDHGYCQSTRQGGKIPAECKFCAAACICHCHQAAPTEPADQLARSDPAPTGLGPSTPASAGEPKASSRKVSDLGSVVEPVVPEEPQP